MTQIIEKLEAIAPINYAEKWDNVGLLVGTREKDAKRIMIALDATDEVIEQAIENNVDMLITHHPMIFSAMKKITEEDFIGRRILALAKHEISYYAMHTNCDVGVMNDVAADKIGLESEDVLEEVTKTEDGKAMGIGKVGMLKQEMTIQKIATLVKNVFDTDYVRVTGELSNKVQRVAISTGAGKSMVSYALDKHAQLLITGDMDHHTAIDALAQGLQIIDAGHFGTEHFMVEYVWNYLCQCLPEDMDVIRAEETNPFQTI